MDAQQSLSFEFGAWVPDIPQLMNPAFPPQTDAYFKLGQVNLIEAANCIWTATGYRSFSALAGTPALPSQCFGAISCYDTNGSVQYFAGTANGLYKLISGAWSSVGRITPAWTASTVEAVGNLIVDSNGNVQQVSAITGNDETGTVAPAWNTTVGGTTTDNNVTWKLLNHGAYQTSSNWSFQVFGNCLDATNGVDVMQTIDITVGTNFAALDTVSTDLVPIPKVLGVIRDFLVAGNTIDTNNGTVPYRLQWSALANDNQWPVPDTQNAFAAQAGAQTLYSEYGPIQAISDNEFFGLIFQTTGIVRAEYVGGSTVFNFYTYEKKRGAIGQNAVVRVGNNYYFCSPDGFFVTDGTSVTPIGYEKVDRWFFANANAGALATVCAAADTRNKLVYFAFQSGGSGLDSLLIYNYEEQNWTHASQSADFIYTAVNASEWIPAGFTNTHAHGFFTGSVGTSTLTTQDFALNPGGRALISMVRPLTDGSPTAAVGSRTTLESSPVWSAYTALSARSGVAGLRSEGLFHEVSIQNSAAFINCVGASIWFAPMGAF